jgi:hypothetical protein
MGTKENQLIYTAQAKPDWYWSNTHILSKRTTPLSLEEEAFIHQAEPVQNRLETLLHISLFNLMSNGSYGHNDYRT